LLAAEAFFPVQAFIATQAALLLRDSLQPQRRSIPMTVENDLVLIHHEDSPVLFARIEEILPDTKPDWYHVKLLLLQVPLQTVTWILRDIYIDGQEFTMNGQRMRLEKVTSPAKKDKPPSTDRPPSKTEGGRVISLSNLKKRE
jgi:hypothetical protein